MCFFGEEKPHSVADKGYSVKLTPFEMLAAVGIQAEWRKGT